MRFAGAFLPALRRGPIFFHQPHGWAAIGITPEVEADFAELARTVLNGRRRRRRRPPEGVRFVTYHNYDSPSLVERSYASRGIEGVVVLARDLRPWTWLGKVEPLLAYLESVCTDTYVIATDASDVLLVNDPAPVVRRFEALACDVLFCNTVADWPPDPEACEFESRVYSGFPCHSHLSAGAYMGRREALVPLLREIVRGARENASWTRYDGRFDDQLCWRRLHRSHYPRLQVDCRSRIFKRFDLFRDRP